MNFDVQCTVKPVLSGYSKIDKTKVFKTNGSLLELSENLTIAPLQCFACSKRPEFLRRFSGKVILTSIKGHNSLTNWRKMTATNPNVDLVSINSYIKFG